MHRRGAPAFSDEVWDVLSTWETRFDQLIDEYDEDIIKIRRHLHAHPEASGEEVATTRYVADSLKELGVESRIYRDDIGATADFTIGSPAPESPLIAIRGDLDALRMPDEKTVAYASQNPGCAHACGHDAHAAILLGIAMAAAGFGSEGENEDGLGAQIRLLFQPAEEICMGATWMVEQGAAEGVDAILGLHVDPECLVGEVGIRYGNLTANCDEVEIVIEGHGGHSARPHQTVDPIAAAAHLVSSLYEFLPRSVDSRHPSVFTAGQLNGGYAPNVIPEHVTIRGSLRTTDASTRLSLQRRIVEICKGAEHSSGTEIRVQFLSPLKAVDNHPRVAAAFEEAAQRVVGPDHIHIIERPSMGGEDFSVYLDHVPGALLRLGCSTPGTEPQFLHSSLFDLDERALATGIKILIRSALLLSIGPKQ